MVLRAITGFFWVALCLFLTNKGGVYFSVYITALMGLSFWEITKIFKLNFSFFILGILSLSTLFIAHFFEFGNLNLLIFGFITAHLLLFLNDFHSLGNLSFERISRYIFAFIYVSLLVFGLKILEFDALVSDLEFKSSVFLICIFILVWSNDSFAYLFGRKFGKNPLMSKISPKKTIEGFAGGLIITLFISVLIAFYTQIFDIIFWLSISSIVCLVSVFGDLFESMIKRTFGVKDSGNLLPGHGGILDRIDSLIFLFPVIYYFVKTFYI